MNYFLLVCLAIVLFAGCLFTDGLGGLIAAVRGLDHSTTVLSHNEVHVSSHNTKAKATSGGDDFVFVTFALLGVFVVGTLVIGLASGGGDPY